MKNKKICQPERELREGRKAKISHKKYNTKGEIMQWEISE